MHKRIILTAILLIFLGFLSFSSPNVARAEGEMEFQTEDVGINLEDKLVLKDGSPVKEVFNSTDDMINLLVKVLFIGSGMVLAGMVIGAGFAMINGGGSDKDKAKTTMTSALAGFVIMFSAYWVLQILQLLTGINMGF